MSSIGLFPGGFKPPHKGHFKLLQELSEKVDKVHIIVGSKIRTGEVISPKQSIDIWKIYNKHINKPVSVTETTSDPVRDVLDWLKENNKNYDKIVIGTTEERTKVYLDSILKYGYSNVELHISDFLPGVNVDKLSSSDVRKNLNYLTSLEWTPEVLTKSEQDSILRILKPTINSVVQEQKMLNTLNGKLSELFEIEEDIQEETKPFDRVNFYKDFISNVVPSEFTTETNENEIIVKVNNNIQEGSSGTPIEPLSAIPSKDRSKLVHLYDQLRSTLDTNTYQVDFQQSRIMITIKDRYSISYDYTPYMGSILEYMIDQGMKITPLPEIKIREDIKESSNFFGKTAFYNPQEREIILYTLGRHPKDVMRSFTHEMIHHKQNLEGKIQNITTTNTNEDSSLLELEQEAYLLGNITFRNWEDHIKNG